MASINLAALLDLPIELLNNIIAECSERDKLSLGLTCQAIWNLSASSLWRSVDSLAVVRGLVQVDMSEYFARPIPRGVNVSDVSLPEGLEDRLFRYGVLIHGLDLSLYWRFGNADFHDHILVPAFSALFDRPNIRDVFPNLSTLCLIISSDNKARFHERLLSCPVVNLDITFKLCSASCITRTIGCIPTWSIVDLSLSFLEYNDTHVNNESNRAVSTFIRELRNLKRFHFRLSSRNKTILEAVAHHPHIEHITLHRMAWDHQGDLSLSLPLQPFASLRSLTLHTGRHRSVMNGADALGFLRSISSSRVERVELDMDNDIGPSAEALLEVIAGKWHDSLTTLELLLVSGHTPMDSDEFFSVIKPLLLCSRTCHCTIATPLGLFLPDERVCSITTAWPELRRFELFDATNGHGGVLLPASYVHVGDANHGPRFEGASPLSLIHFAEHCPRLEVLRFATFFDWPSSKSYPAKVSPSRLTHFDGTGSRRGNMRASEVSDFVGAIFPHSSTVGCPPDCANEGCIELGLHSQTWPKELRGRYFGS